MAFYMVPTLAFSVAFNLPKFFEFVIQWAPTSRAVIVDAATNETRFENGTEMAFKGSVDGENCVLYADKVLTIPQTTFPFSLMITIQN